MINIKICEWLLENADAPIRYRIAREFLKEEKMVLQIESELLDNSIVKLWLKNLKPNEPPQHRWMVNGCNDFNLENAMTKCVQLGLHAGLPQVTDAVSYYLNIFKNSPAPKRKYSKNDTIINLEHIANYLTLAGFQDIEIREYMLKRLDIIYNFVRFMDYNIYISEEDRAELKGVPKHWEETEYFVKDNLFIKTSFGEIEMLPEIRDIIVFHKLYDTCNPEINKKIDAVIEYISNDDYHSTIASGYGIKMAGKNKYHGVGWDAKYPGWFDVSYYINNDNERTVHNILQTTDCPGYVYKLLFFAEHIVKYPIALKTKWYADLTDCLEKYKTDNGTYIFPKEWLPEKKGYVVGGFRMSFGENRRKKNWLEIESTFYMQLLKQNI